MDKKNFVGNITNVEALGNVVPDGYLYFEKVIVPREDLALANAYLKWYDLTPRQEPITEAQGAECRAFLTGEAEAGRLELHGELGFVILHRAGSALLVLFTVWRSTNEMWEAVYYKEHDGVAPYRQIMTEGTPRGTYCVWELGAVWHERNAWVRFLSSARDEQAKLEWVNDRFSGMV